MWKKLMNWLWGNSSYNTNNEELLLNSDQEIKDGHEKFLSAKEKATLAGEPYVAIINIELDPDNVNKGSIELDWNDKFIINLIRAGYKISENDTDNDIVDRWFTQVCRNIVMEIYEQDIADPEKRMIEELRNREPRIINRKDLGDGKVEIS
jgi:hypothetical protein